LEELGVHERIILKWLFRQWVVGWTGLIWLSLRIGNGLL
jgi:hypothetical protein